MSTRIEVPIRGAWQASALATWVDNSVRAFNERYAGEQVKPSVVLVLQDDATIDFDGDMKNDLEVSQVIQDPLRGYQPISLTITGGTDYKLVVSQQGIRLYGDFTMLGGNVKTQASSQDTALYAEGTISLKGGILEAKGDSRGIHARKALEVADPARVTAEAGMAASYAAAIYCDGDVVIESGNIMSARGANAIYGKGDITVTGGYVNASTSSNSMPAVHAENRIMLSDNVKVLAPGQAQLVASISVMGASGAQSLGYSIGAYESVAPVVVLSDGTTRDDVFYKNYGNQASGGDGNGGDGSGGDGNTTGGDGNGNSDGTGGDGNNGSNGNNDGNGGSGGDGTGGDGGTTNGNGSGGTTGSGGGSNTGAGSGTGSGSGTGGKSTAIPSASASSVPTGEGDSSGSTFRLLRASVSSVKSDSLVINWRKQAKAVQYEVWGAPCGKKNRYQFLELAAGKSYTHRGLKPGTYYKYYIVARQANGEIVAKSRTIHVATAGGKYTNFKKVTIDKKQLYMRRGTTAYLSAAAKKASSKKKVSVHRGIRFESSNKKVAKVTSKGKVTAKGASGTSCYIYAYAQNGVYARAKVVIP